MDYYFDALSDAIKKGIAAADPNFAISRVKDSLADEKPLLAIRNYQIGNCKFYRMFNPEKIKNVEFYPPAVKMTFTDGTVTTSVAQGDDKYNPEQGMIMCILQYIFMGKTYNNMFRKWIKADEDRKAEDKAFIEAVKEAKEIAARQEAKEQKRKAQRAARKREEAIEIQKEAYLRAMKEASNKEEV